MKIARIVGREIYDSQGWPTVQCELYLDTGASVIASVPSGISVGPHEAIEIRDGGTRMQGKGVRKALDTIENIIAPVLIGQRPQAIEMDIKMLELDGTPDKSNLGANAMLAVSMALYRAEALCEHVELYEFIAMLCEAESVAMPFPMLNIINGGAHVDNKLQIQEFMVVPVGGQTFRSSFEAGVLVFHELGALLKKAGKSIAVGPEGGYACNFSSEIEALDTIMQAVETIQNQHAISCVIALDCAASQFYNSDTGRYHWHNKKLSTDAIIDLYEDLANSYPIYSLEDPLSDEDINGWIELTKRLEQKVQIVGDDIFATDPYRIVMGIQDKAATAAIIKPNQIGTIAETLQAIALCKNSNIGTVISHRSRDTEDTFIADLAVGTSAGQIKAGSTCRSERLAKYNRLLAIEDTLTFAQLDS